jgi:hypothetical protein
LETHQDQGVADTTPEAVAPGLRKPGVISHGGYSVQVRQRYSDARTTEGRALRAVMDGLRKDLGTVSIGQSLILGRVREKLIVLMQIGSYVDKQPSAITAEGELLPCLGRGYTAFSEALRRDVELLYVMAKRTPARVPSLSEYLASKRR